VREHRQYITANPLIFHAQRQRGPRTKPRQPVPVRIHQGSFPVPGFGCKAANRFAVLDALDCRTQAGGVANEFKPPRTNPDQPSSTVLRCQAHASVGAPHSCSGGSFVDRCRVVQGDEPYLRAERWRATAKRSPHQPRRAHGWWARDADVSRPGINGKTVPILPCGGPSRNDLKI